MHMADALLAPAVAGAMYIASGAAAGHSLIQLKKELIYLKLALKQDSFKKLKGNIMRY